MTIPDTDVKISDIYIEKRARVVDDITELIASIKHVGLLTPITLRRQSVPNKQPYILVCGARRLAAFKTLNLTKIPAYVKDIKENVVAAVAELEENLQRSDFTWQEETQAKCLLYYTMKQQDPAMTQQAFSDIFHQSAGKTSMQLDLFDNISVHPKAWFEDGIKKASEILRRLKIDTLVAEKVQRLAGIQTTKVESDNTPSCFEETEQCELNKDIQPHISIYPNAADLLSSLSDHSVDLICTDPPFGINILNARKNHGSKDGVYDEKYDDSEHAYSNLLTAVVPEFVRVLKPGSCIYMFFGISLYKLVTESLRSFKCTINPVPMIWHRTGSGSAACQPKYLPASSYQAIMMAYTPGNRKILQHQGKSNVLTYPTVPHTDKTHPMEIPVDVYQDLMWRSVCTGDLIIDPFCGTGNSLVAAKKLGCNIRGAEIKEDYRNIAELKLREEIG